MNSIPTDLYERVQELLTAIANASGSGDEVLLASAYEELRAYYLEQGSLGRDHPFLTEALADVTDDLTERMRLYELSLEQARAFDGEPVHTKLISLADVHFELYLVGTSDLEIAKELLRRGLVEAEKQSDRSSIEEAVELKARIELVEAMYIQKE